MRRTDTGASRRVALLDIELVDPQDLNLRLLQHMPVDLVIRGLFREIRMLLNTHTHPPTQHSPCVPLSSTLYYPRDLVL